MLSTTEALTSQQFQDKVQEFRTICHLHACPTGQWENLIDLPLRLSRDARLRADLVVIVRSLQRSHVPLPDALEMIVLAVGGSMAPQHKRQLAEPLNLLDGFLGSIGRWPDASTEPILAPGEIPANLQNFIRPQPSPQQVRPAELREAPPADPVPRLQPGPIPVEDLRPTQPRAEQPQPVATPVRDDRIQPQPIHSVRATPAPAPHPTSVPPDDHTVSDLARVLARLELGNLELRAHLDSIDQRISRMEPLLESGAPSGPASPSAPDQASPRTGPAPEDPFRFGSLRTEALHTAPFHPEPLRTDALRSDPLQAEPLHTAPLGRSESLPLEEPRAQNRPRENAPPQAAAAPSRPASPADPAEVVPRFSRFLRDPGPSDPIAAPVTPEAPPAVAAQEALRSETKPDEPRPINLPRGFFGTVPDPDPADASDLALELAQEKSRARRRRIILIIVLLVLAGLAVAGFLYMRSMQAAADQAANTITPVPAPRAPNEGPLLSSGSRPSGTSTVAPANGRVLGARNAFQPRQTSEDLKSPSGFRPASIFVPAAVMDGRLISAPMPPTSRLHSYSGNKGMVVLEANISSSGEVEDLNVLGGNRALRSAALQAVRNWRYKPYLLNGTAIEVRTIVRVDFNRHSPQPAVRSAPFPS